MPQREEIWWMNMRSSASAQFSLRWLDPWEKSMVLDGHECVGSESHQHHHIRWDDDSGLQPKATSQEKSRKLPGCLAGQNRVSLLCPHLKSSASEMASLQGLYRATVRLPKAEGLHQGNCQRAKKICLLVHEQGRWSQRCCWGDLTFCPLP